MLQRKVLFLYKQIFSHRLEINIYVIKRTIYLKNVGDYPHNSSCTEEGENKEITISMYLKYTHDY
jgi:hypothetical protein